MYDMNAVMAKTTMRIWSRFRRIFLTRNVHTVSRD
jgi:hypothetical protein